MIVLENKVVFVLSNLHSSSKVTRFKPTFEYQGVIVFVLFLVIGLELAIISIYLGHFCIEI